MFDNMNISISIINSIKDSCPIENNIQDTNIYIYKHVVDIYVPRGHHRHLVLICCQENTQSRTQLNPFCSFWNWTCSATLFFPHSWTSFCPYTVECGFFFSCSIKLVCLPFLSELLSNFIDYKCTYAHMLDSHFMEYFRWHSFISAVVVDAAAADVASRFSPMTNTLVAIEL